METGHASYSRRSLRIHCLQLLGVLFVGLSASVVGAATEPNTSSSSSPNRLTTPIFGQLVTFSFPKGFVPAFENTSGASYIKEAVPDGETVQKWTQMLTVTGAKGLARNEKVTPQVFVNALAGGFNRSCPESFSGVALGTMKVGMHDAFVAVISCGTTGTADSAYSESMLVVAIKGDTDYYTIQWAERAVPSTTALALNKDMWLARLRRLGPIKLCPLIPGEAVPYASCMAEDLPPTALPP